MCRRFKKSKRFAKAVGLINEVDAARLPRLLSRVLQKLPHKVPCRARVRARQSRRASARVDARDKARPTRTPLPPAAQTESTFSDAEAAQLCELFGLSDDQLTLLLSGSSYIFEEGAYATTPHAYTSAWRSMA